MTSALPRFLIFCSNRYYPLVGFEDCVGGANTLAQAMNKCDTLWEGDDYTFPEQQIIDTHILHKYSRSYPDANWSGEEFRFNDEQVREEGTEK